MSTTSFYLLPIFPIFQKNHHAFLHLFTKPYPSPCPRSKFGYKPRLSRSFVCCSNRKTIPDYKMDSVDCVGNGNDVECFTSDTKQLLPSSPPANKSPPSFEISAVAAKYDEGLLGKVIDWALLVSPFFFWGTAMVAMKEVILKTGPFFVSAFRLIPAGAILIGFAAARGRQQPTGLLAWISIFLFGVVDGACFQAGLFTVE